MPIFVNADYVGQTANFFIDPSYDLSKREEISATLQKISQNLYFYIDDSWWNSLDDSQRNEIGLALDNLAAEFKYKIYSFLTSTFGEEWKPGIDNNDTITILFHRMKEGAGGYFNSGDEYPRAQNPRTNKREMVYLNTDDLKSPLIKSYLAHEFTHLITFNQKDRLRGVSEEVWLNEARADFSSTLLGYDDKYQASNLEQKVRTFLANPNDSLTEWSNQTTDYGALNLFTQYLVDHYGIKILADSLQSSKTGIPSINEALAKNGFQEDFSKIFTDWTIAVSLGDCQVGEKYCYKNENLKNFRVIPSLIFLPSTQKTTLSLNYSIKQWSGNWYRIIGGEGDLKLEFDGADQTQFKVVYILCQDSLNCKVNFLNLDKSQKGEILISDFNKNYTSLTLIPSIQTKTSNFSDKEPFFNFSLSISTEIKVKEEKEAELIKQLLAQIDFLQKEIAKVQAQINAILAKKIGTCTFSADLYFGIMNSPEVRCLQEFLKAQGPEIYPEGLITGNFLSLTQAAAIRFQEKYANEILRPLGLERGTGFVGAQTRTKINQLLTQ